MIILSGSDTQRRIVFFCEKDRELSNSKCSELNWSTLFVRNWWFAVQKLKKFYICMLKYWYIALSFKYETYHNLQFQCIYENYRLALMKSECVQQFDHNIILLIIFL